MVRTSSGVRALLLGGAFLLGRPAMPGEPLARRVDPGLEFGDFVPGEGLPVEVVSPAGAAAAAGVRPGDVLVGLDGRAFTSELDAAARLAALRAGAPAVLELARGGVRTARRVAFPPLPPDTLPGVDFSYEEVRNPRSGLPQRVILSRPAGSTGRLPAVLFIPWLSCDSVEAPAGARGGIETLLYRIAADSGFVLMRVEKPGVGDSPGVCSETDFETELAGHRAAFAALKDHPWVDSARLVAMGQSFAGGLLPLVAPPSETRGYLFLNSYVRTWLERLLEFERKRLEAKGLAAGPVSERMRRLADLYAQVLEGGRTPAEAIRGKPELAAAWEDAPEHQYGRPIVFMRQLQATNVAAAWETVDRPTLAVWGEADIVMHRTDHERVVAIVNRNRPGAARLLTVPGMGHGLSAPRPGGGRGLPDSLAGAILDWLRATLGPG